MQPLVNNLFRCLIPQTHWPKFLPAPPLCSACKSDFFFSHAVRDLMIKDVLLREDVPLTSLWRRALRSWCSLWASSCLCLWGSTSSRSHTLKTHRTENTENFAEPVITLMNRDFFLILNLFIISVCFLLKLISPNSNVRAGLSISAKCLSELCIFSSLFILQ